MKKPFFLFSIFLIAISLSAQSGTTKQLVIELKQNTITDVAEGMPMGVWLVVKARN